ncbi:MAG: PD-(D/E)XK nuclease family protein [Terracidiphilus sp.]|nr:PD-(D/E)XK nuclease family protein [Terracidiphilus sp.]
MGVLLDPELEQWLEAGERVVTASERAARALIAAYDLTRRNRGETAWATPRIEPWQHFLESAWMELADDERMVLHSVQERALWAAIVASERELTATLDASRARLGALAFEAHTLLANYAPHLLAQKPRQSWQGDQGTFSRWLDAFEARCHADSLLSGARLALELASLLEQRKAAERPPLLLVGFDRLQPAQRTLLDAWGKWRTFELKAGSAQPRFFAAPDEKTELRACARWCNQQLQLRPQSHLLVISQDVARNRGLIERAFLEETASAHFEFSLGVEISSTALVRAARLVLRWFSEPIAEDALDWLLACGHLTANGEEQTALQRRMRRLRERGRQRTEWTLDAFLAERSDAAVPATWRERISEARSLLEAQIGSQSLLAWTEFVPRLLETAGWAGGRSLTSAEYQIQRRFFEALDTCASLGFVTHMSNWSGFLPMLERILDETVYAPESAEAPILIAGPTEAAGLAADAIWFTGATEDAWPATGSTHPFLPLAVQREAAMPHAHPGIDWELAEAVTLRLLRSAPEVCFSYARQKSGVEAEPSRLVLKFAEVPLPLPAELLPAPHGEPRTIVCEDSGTIPYPAGGASGGSELITNQSLCPFRAFASARLGARDWNAAEAGLSAAQRGTLLHAVLHSIWSGAPQGIRTQAELLALPDRTAFIRTHIELVFERGLPSGARERMPACYLALEKQRLAVLLTEWLDYEATRVEFEVAATELEDTPTIEGLSLRLRLDRIDRLTDETLLVVDYKTGDVTPKSWELPRPEDLQLPLYAAFGQLDGEVSGLVFAKVRKGKQEFTGRVGRAQETLLSSLSTRSALVKQPLTGEQLMGWRDEIETLAAAFVAGDADVNPCKYPETCERCALPGLCRVRDFPPAMNPEDADENDGEAADE